MSEYAYGIETEKIVLENELTTLVDRYSYEEDSLIDETGIDFERDKTDSYLEVCKLKDGSHLQYAFKIKEDGIVLINLRKTFSAPTNDLYECAREIKLKVDEHKRLDTYRGKTIIFQQIMTFLHTTIIDGEVENHDLIDQMF